MAGDFSDTLEAGTTYKFVIWEEEEDANGDTTLADLTGATFEFQINDLSADPKTIIHTSTTANGEITLLENNKKMQALIPVAITETFAPGEYNFAIRRTLGGATETWVSGDIKIVQPRVLDE